MQWNERQDVEGAYARMYAGMRAQIDPFNRNGRKRDCRFAQLRVAAGDRQNAAVVNRIARAVQNVRARRMHGINARINDRCIAAFRNIWNAFEQHLGQRESDRARDIGTILRCIQRAVSQFICFGNTARRSADGSNFAGKPEFAECNGIRFERAVPE